MKFKLISVILFYLFFSCSVNAAIGVLSSVETETVVYAVGNSICSKDDQYWNGHNITIITYNPDDSTINYEFGLIVNYEFDNCLIEIDVPLRFARTGSRVRVY